jgi:hypothetical protein
MARSGRHPYCVLHNGFTSSVHGSSSCVSTSTVRGWNSDTDRDLGDLLIAGESTLERFVCTSSGTENAPLPGSAGTAQQQTLCGSIAMLETIAIVLLLLWIFGMVSSYTVGGLIHILLVVAIVIFLLRVIRGRRVV